MKQTKVWVGAFAVIAVVAVGLFLMVRRSGNDDAVRIGAILPLTGEAAQYGQNDRDGILLAVEEANAAGGIGGRKIEVVFEDCQTDAKLALSAFNKLKSQGVPAVIDDAISTISLSLVPQLESSRTVLLSTGASNPALSGASPYFFRVWNSDTYEGQVVADYITKTYPGGQVVILQINSDYGTGLRDVVVKALGVSGLKPPVVETFEKDARDFRQQVAKVAAAAPDVVYLIGYAAQTGPLARQLREGGVKVPLVGTVAMEDPEFIKLAGPAAEGVVYPFAVPPEGDAVKAFQAAFRAKYGKEAGLLNDCGYDAAKLLIDAMRDHPADGAAIRESLSRVTNYSGASGTITFDKNGDVHKPMQMKGIRDGKFQPIP